MAIYLDPPMWPAHGTLFAHLVSDTSLEELHGFAAAAGISGRAFDRDHYDVAAHRCAELAELGARQVDARTLARILRGSGLRVPARQRNNAVITPLRQRWSAVVPDRPKLGEELIERWGEPHRKYHDRTHLLTVLEAIDTLTGGPKKQLPRAVVLAAWFHDAVYEGAAGTDEEQSAALAEARLPEVGLPASEVAETARLVHLTISHAPEPKDVAGALLCDADLSVLGRDPAGYRRYLRAVRDEYGAVPDADFAAGRAAVVRRLLERDPLFATTEGRRRWERQARVNLAAELAGSDPF